MILVTGATGFLGSHLLHALLQKGEQVRALKRDASSLDGLRRVFNFYGEEFSERSGQIEWVSGDLSDIFSLYDALDGVTDVYHCAAKVSFNRSQKTGLQKTNVTGTANLVDACMEKGIRRLCHVSTIGALGSDEAGGLIDELSPRKVSSRHSVYSNSKYLGELEVWRGIAEGLDAVIINPAVIIGPGSTTNGSGALFRLVQKGLKYYTPGKNAYVDVRDVVKIMIMLMESQVSGERFVVAAENLSYKELLTMIAGRTGKEPPSRKAGKAMLTMAWAFNQVKYVITKEKPEFDHDFIRILTSRTSYNADKIKERTGIEWMTVERSLDDLY